MCAGGRLAVPAEENGGEEEEGAAVEGDERARAPGSSMAEISTAYGIGS